MRTRRFIVEQDQLGVMCAGPRRRQSPWLGALAIIEPTFYRWKRKCQG
jgi:hypothetical protein